MPKIDSHDHFFSKSHFLPIFEKGHFGRFFDAPHPSCAVRLSWKLREGSDLPLRAPKSIFSSNGQHTKNVERSQFGDFGRSRGHPANFAQNQNGHQKGILGTSGCQFCLDLLVSSFWPRTCLLSNFFELSKKWPPDRHFWPPFCPEQMPAKVGIWGQFLKVQTNCWKCTF